MKNINGLVITDLDGTLLNSDHQLSETNKNTLETLVSKSFIRAIATGRSLKVARKVLKHDFPIDYLIFSSGAGIMKWSNQQLIHETHMDSPAVNHIRNFLIQENHDFMLHQSVPENHYFEYFNSGKANPDFYTRLNLYKDYAKPLTESYNERTASQFIVVIPPHKDTHKQFDFLKTTLTDFSIIYATSPLDGQSAWIEIFPKTVSKSQAGQWLMNYYQLETSQTMAIGNDFNDRDLLDWAGKSFIVDNAPLSLKSKHQCVSSNNKNGFSEAIQEWLGSKP